MQSAAIKPNATTLASPPSPCYQWREGRGVFGGVRRRKMKGAWMKLLILPASRRDRKCHIQYSIGKYDAISQLRFGENPLYIVALRGHCKAVDISVRHCCKTNINKQNAKAYGDGWKPLMAAAVSDRHDVAKVLLKAVNINMGTNLDDTIFNENAMCASKKVTKMNLISHLDNNFVSENVTCLKDNKINIDKSDMYASTILKILQKYQSACASFHIHLLDAQNRYGQIALHIVARTDSIWFVYNLLIAGASMDICDCYMMRVVDVANHHKRKVVANILRKWDAIQRNHDLFRTQQ